MPIQMTTTKPHRYAGKWLNVGDKFTAKGESDARLLSALGRAKRVELQTQLRPYEPPKNQAPRAEVRSVQVPRQPMADPASAPTLEDVDAEKSSEDKVGMSVEQTNVHHPVKPKRTYTRRDMTAKE